MYSKNWKLVDFRDDVGMAALATLKRVVPQLCGNAHPDLLDCLRSCKSTGFEMAFVQLEFTNEILRHLDPAGIYEYAEAMTEKLGSKEYVAPAQIVKWWQFGLYCQEISRSNPSRQNSQSPRWLVPIQSAVDKISQIDHRVTNPDAGKKLAELFPKLRTEPIEGLFAKIDELIKVAAYHFTAVMRTSSILLCAVPFGASVRYSLMMEETAQGQPYPNFYEAILSIQYPLCMEHLMEEGTGTTPNRRLEFMYKDYY